MPGSNPQGKARVLDFVVKHEEIKKIVDFGAGQGIYGHLLKGTMPWLKMTAVEIWEPYITKYGLWHLYDDIIKADICNLDWPDADMAIFGDVLEHMEKDEAVETIMRAIQKYPHIVISIPIADKLQGPECGNPYECHKYLWQIDELKRMFGAVFPIIEFEQPLLIMIK